MIKHSSLVLILQEQNAEDPALTEAVETLRAEGCRVDMRLSRKPGQTELLAEEAARQGAEVVVAAGGDGTVSQVANGLWHAGKSARAALGIVPMGTGNDFATSCGIEAGDPLAALRLIRQTEPTRIDLAQMNDRMFINVASGGFGAEVSAGTSSGSKELLGKLAYLFTGMISIFQISARPLKLRGPDFAWEGNAYVMAVGNGSQAGGGFRLCERASLVDGLLDLFVLPDVPFLDGLGVLGSLLTGNSPQSEQTIYHQFPWLEVEAPESLYLTLDGEPVRGDRFRFEVHRGALACILPQHHDKVTR
jgi:lipid kinase YegS